MTTIAQFITNTQASFRKQRRDKGRKRGKRLGAGKALLAGTGIGGGIGLAIGVRKANSAVKDVRDRALGAMGMARDRHKKMIGDLQKRGMAAKSHEEVLKVNQEFLKGTQQYQNVLNKVARTSNEKVAEMAPSLRKMVGKKALVGAGVGALAGLGGYGAYRAVKAIKNRKKKAKKR